MSKFLFGHLEWKLAREGFILAYTIRIVYLTVLARKKITIGFAISSKKNDMICL